MFIALRCTYTLETQLHCKNVPKRETPRWLPIEVIVLVKLATLTLVGINVNCFAHLNNNSLSVSPTISKFSCPTKLTDVYQLDRAKIDLRTARFFELEWVVQIQFIGQWFIALRATGVTGLISFFHLSSFKRTNFKRNS
jgi:hypothetical protein